MNAGLAVLAGVIVLYGALALRLGRWSISMPIIFVAVGYLLGSGGTGLLDISPTAESIRALAELTLAVLLFADASTLHLQQLRADARLPPRLLTVGLVFTIGLGSVVGLGLLPAEGFALAALRSAPSSRSPCSDLYISSSWCSRSISDHAMPALGAAAYLLWHMFHAPVRAAALHCRGDACIAQRIQRPSAAPFAGTFALSRVGNEKRGQPRCTPPALASRSVSP